MNQSQAAPRLVAAWVESYPQQTAKMKSYALKHGVPLTEAEDIVSQGWTRALETYDPSCGLDVVQWAWYILQHNLVPQYGRSRKVRGYQTTLEDDPPDEATQTIETDDPEQLVRHLRANLPADLLIVFDAMADVTAATDSQHIYQQVAARLNITMPECRNRVKRLKRACIKIRKNYYQ